MSQYHGKNWNSGRGRIANPRHQPDEQSIEEQRREREALSSLEAPFPVRDEQLPHHPLDCPDPLGIHCAEGSKGVVRKVTGAPAHEPEESGIDLITGEPLPLVDQSRKREQDYGEGP